MPGPVFLEGETIELRTIETDDADFLQRLLSDPRVRDGIAAVQPVNCAAEREWIDSLGEDDGAHFLVCIDGDPVGSIGLESPNEAWGSVEVGYMIAPSEWGNGYATDALRAVCGYAFEERRLNKVYAGAYATNPASCRVLEKAGFSEEGLLREEAFAGGEYVDVHRYGLLASEWRSRTERRQ